MGTPFNNLRSAVLARLVAIREAATALEVELALAEGRLRLVVVDPAEAAPERADGAGWGEGSLGPALTSFAHLAAPVSNGSESEPNPPGTS